MAVEKLLLLLTQLLQLLTQLLLLLTQLLLLILQLLLTLQLSNYCASNCRRPFPRGRLSFFSSNTTHAYI
jgi:hypothetical protein